MNRSPELPRQQVDHTANWRTRGPSAPSASLEEATLTGTSVDECRTEARARQPTVRMIETMATHRYLMTVQRASAKAARSTLSKGSKLNRR